MYRKNLYYAALLLSHAFPTAARAQNIDTIVVTIGTTLKRIIGLLFLVATVVFLWGVIKFIASAGDEGARNKARGIMTWGIVGLAVMAAAWGITALIINYFGIPEQPPVFVPPPVE